MDLVTNAVWQQYKDIINQGQDTFFQDDITWLRSRGGLSLHGEDNLAERFTTIILKGLINYNNFRTWPVIQGTVTGLLDKESEVLLLNMKYLTDNNYLNPNGQFVYNQDIDRFIHKGVKYKAAGDSLIAQAKDEPLLFMIILQREIIATSQSGK